MELYELRRLILSGWVDFIEHGTTVDLNPTSSSVLPDDDPIENWTDATLGSALGVDFDKKEKTDEVVRPSEEGDWEQEDFTRVLADYLDIELENHSEPIFRLLFGMKQKMTGTTGQRIYAHRGDRSINGWLRLRGKNQDGTDMIVAKIEVKMMLKSYPGWKVDAPYPVVRFQVKNNALNDIIDTEVLAA